VPSRTTISAREIQLSVDERGDYLPAVFPAVRLVCLGSLPAVGADGAVIWLLSWRSPASSQAVPADLAYQAAVVAGGRRGVRGRYVTWLPVLIIKPVAAQLAVALAVASMPDSHSAIMWDALSARLDDLRRAKRERPPRNEHGIGDQ